MPRILRARPVTLPSSPPKNAANASERGLDRLRWLAARVDEIERQAGGTWNDIKPLVIGRKVKRYRKVYLVSGGHTAFGFIHLFGTLAHLPDGSTRREYSLGRLDQCEFVDE